MTFDTHENLKKIYIYINKNTTMIRTPANFFANVKNLQRIVGYIRKVLEYWNTAKERRNLRSFDMKTSPHRAAIFFFAFHGSYYPSELD